MIFKDLIDELQGVVAQAVEELFNAAWMNQSHPQDMLLVDQHGFYEEFLVDKQVREHHILSPYVIGPSTIISGEITLYKFIDWYRQSHILEKEQFERQVQSNQQAKLNEELTVQLEQSIYLRFWEADSLLKQYYQLSKLACGKPYDWHLKIPVHPREGSKQHIIRKKIRDRVKDACPKFYTLVKGNFVSQVRNAIAHSQFYLEGRGMYFLNYSDNPSAYSSLKGMSFDEWYRMFHTTLLLHNATIKSLNTYRQHYKEKTLDNGNRITVRITKKDKTEKLSDVSIPNDRDEWVWYGNLNDDDRRGKNI